MRAPCPTLGLPRQAPSSLPPIQGQRQPQCKTRPPHAESASNKTGSFADPIAHRGPTLTLARSHASQATDRHHASGRERSPLANSACCRAPFSGFRSKPSARGLLRKAAPRAAMRPGSRTRHATGTACVPEKRARQALCHLAQQRNHCHPRSDHGHCSRISSRSDRLRRSEAPAKQRKVNSQVATSSSFCAHGF